MKIKITFLVIIIILFNLDFFGKEDINGQEWKGKVEYKERTKIIRNPAQPVFGELNLDLVLDLSIRERKGYNFYIISQIEIDSEGNIYALDSRTCQILKFDKNGKYLQKIGRKGQGPGEFEDPRSFFIDSNKNIYVGDNRRIHIFDKSGKFIKSIRLNYKIYDFFLNFENNIIALGHIISKEGPESAILKFNTKGEKVKEMVKFPGVKAFIKEAKKDFFLSLYIIVIIIWHISIPSILISLFMDTLMNIKYFGWTVMGIKNL